jgi:3-dehydroquinate synthase
MRLKPSSWFPNGSKVCRNRNCAPVGLKWLNMHSSRALGRGGGWLLESIAPLISESCAIKLDIVEQDPFEQGLRKVLNFGHTVGHALEAWSNAKGKPLPHGMCVGYGIVWALRWGSPAIAEDIIPHFENWLNADFPRVPAAELWPWMVHDKKNSGREVREVVLDAVGTPRWDVPLKESDFVEAWELVLRA